MHLSNSMEIRNFGSDQYFVGQAGQMPGSQNFIVEAVIRVLAPILSGDPQVIFGNADADNSSGWLLSTTAQANTSPNGEQLWSLNFSVSGSATLTVVTSFPLANVLGKTLHILIWVSTVDIGEGNVSFASIMVNGGLVGSVSLSDFTALPSSAAPSVGFSGTFPFLPLTAASILSVGYTETNAPTEDNLGDFAAGAAARFLDTMKRAMVLVPIDEDAFLSVGPEMTYAYDVATSNGSIGTGQPSVLVNAGSAAPSGNLTKTGVGTTLVTTAAYTEWGSPVVMYPGG